MFRKLSFLFQLDKKLKLKTKMIISISLFLLFSSLATGYISYYVHLNIAEKEISEQFHQKVNQVLARVDLWVKDIYRYTNSILFHPSVTSYLQASNESGVVSYASRMQLNQVLNEMLLHMSYVLSIHIYDNNGQVFKPMNSVELKEFDEQLYMEIEQELEQTDGELIWLSREFEKHNVIIAARKLKDEQLHTQGQLIIILDERSLKQLVDEMIVNNDTVYILNPAQTLLYSNQLDKDSLLDPMKEGTQTTKGSRLLNATSYSDDTGFTVVSRISLDKLQEKSKVIFSIILFSGILSILIAGLPITLLNNRFLSPMKSVLKGMRRVGEGDFNTTIAVQSNDEFAFIGERFNSMVQHINLLIKDVYEKQLMQREAELTALQAQLNPHFLYNTLDMLRSKLYLQEDHENAELIVSLSQMLRYSLESASMYTTIQEEINQISNYLMLQKARFGEGLSVIINIDNTILSYPIMRLLLQPIVENSFAHGFIDRGYEMELHIDGYKDHDNIVIEISDNGCGMDGEMIRNLTEPKENQLKMETKNIGIHNVLRRIDLVYGKGNYRFEIESELNHGTIVRIVLPFIK